MGQAECRHSLRPQHPAEMACSGSSLRRFACDMQDAIDLNVRIMAMMAQQEREAISRRIKEALQALRARGVRLGNPAPQPSNALGKAL